MSEAHSALAPERPNGLRFVSLYSGAGGLDLGFARAGFTPVFANDIDPDAVRTHNNLHRVQDPEWRAAASRVWRRKGCRGNVRRRNGRTCSWRSALPGLLGGGKNGSE